MNTPIRGLARSDSCPLWAVGENPTEKRTEGVHPVEACNALLGGWPEDEPVEDSVAAVREWRRQDALCDNERPMSDVVIVDTDGVSFLFKGDTRAQAYRRPLQGRALAVSFMIVAELYQWACVRNWGEGFVFSRHESHELSRISSWFLRCTERRWTPPKALRVFEGQLHSLAHGRHLDEAV